MNSSDEMNSKVDLYCFYIMMGVIALFIIVILMLVLYFVVKGILMAFLGG